MRPLAAALAGVAGLALWIVAVGLDPQGAVRAWLTAWMYGLSLALGALCLVMIAYVTGARWFVVVRRLAETMAMALPALALGVIPLFVGMRSLYPWSRPPGTLAPEVREVVGKIDAWLDPTFFVGRSIVYLGVWIVLAVAFWRWSVAMDDRHPDDARDLGRAGNPAGLAAGGLILFGFTVTFASFDWLMSMTPRWYSTVFGVYFFAGAMLAALSAMVIATRALESGGALQGVVAASHYYALGRLMLTFVIFWAYIAYSQGFLIWIGDIPREIDWYLARWDHGWVWVLGTLAVAHFALPFLVLLDYTIKRRPRPLSWVAAWLLVVHWLDLYWIVGPAPDGAGAVPGLLSLGEQLTALLAVLGLGYAFSAWMLGARPRTPRGDPAWTLSLEYDAK